MSYNNFGSIGWMPIPMFYRTVSFNPENAFVFSGFIDIDTLIIGF